MHDVAQHLNSVITVRLGLLFSFELCLNKHPRLEKELREKLAIFFWIMQGGHAKGGGVGGVDVHLLFSFELCRRRKTADGAGVEAQCLAIFFWIMPARPHIQEVRPSRQPLAIFFWIMPPSIVVAWPHPRVLALLFSFELCLVVGALAWYILQPQVACYFLLNYAYLETSLKAWSPKSFSCYFLLNYANFVIKVKRLCYSGCTCYFLLNYALRSRSHASLSSSCYSLAIFFWIMRYIPLNLAMAILGKTCYFLLNYAPRRMWGTPLSSGLSLLAIFFWIMLG